MRRIFFFFLFVILMLSMPNFAKRYTQGFRVAKMGLNFPHHPEWEIDPNPAVLEILKQRYSFLGKGAQSYVFASQDGKYVIKLFRYDQPPKEGKVILLFDACKLAYDHLREETGLIYIHLNPTPMNLPVLHCKDAVGRSYKFPLDQVRFALQKRAKPLRETLLEARSDPDQMGKRIDQLLALLQARTAKKVYNSDPNLSRNFGFLEDKSIEFDFGNYQNQPGLDSAVEIRRYTERLRRFLKENAPEWVAYLDERTR